MFAGIAQTRYFQIIDAAGDPVDLTTLTGNVTWTATGNAGNYTIGPKICTIEDATTGTCSCNLTASETAHVDLYQVQVSVGAPFNKLSYLEDLWIINQPFARAIPVVSGQQFSLDFVIKDNTKSVVDLTGLTVYFYTKPEQYSAGTIAGTVTVTDAVNGLVNVVHTLTSNVFGYFVVDTIITTDLRIVVQ